MAAGEKTGGRRKGTPNKASAETAAAVSASGKTPLAYMLSVMRDRKAPRDVRLDAAKSAAPYVHPKLQAIEHFGPDRDPIQHEHTHKLDPASAELIANLVK